MRLRFGLILLAVLGCESGGTRVDFQVRLAPSDSACTPEDSGSLPGEVLVRICPVSGVDCLMLSEDSELLRTPIDLFESEPIDIPDTSERMRVDVQVCQGENVIAFASADNTNLRAGVDLVLHRTQSTSCGSTTLPRAFGNAVALPNGEVLMFGGVELNLPGTQGEVGDMIETVEVYDPAADESHRIEGAFSGAFGSALLVSTEGNVHRVRVFGGLQADAGSAAFQLNRSTAARAGFFGLPVQPTDATRYASVRDLVYDSVARSVRVEPLAGVDGTGFNTGTDELATFGVSSTGQPVGGGARIASGGMLELFDTQVDRLGNSATDVGDGSVMLWGGPILEPMGNVQANAGEILNALTLTTSLVAAPPEEIPTAFHEAASLAPGQVLLAGGLQSICVGDCQLKVSQIYAVVPLRVMTIDGLRIAVEGAGVTPAIFQASATTSDAWLLTGGTGAIDGQEGQQFAFEPTDQVTVVTEQFGTYNARPLTPLRHARFGHSMVAIANGSGVVFGGVEVVEGGFSATGVVEWVVAGPAENLCALSAVSP